jgi:hypothetical protein
MNSETNQGQKNISVSRIIGYFLLIPPSISIFLFVGQLINPAKFMFAFWTANHASYFGLMALAGAYLIKSNNNA